MSKSQNENVSGLPHKMFFWVLENVGKSTGVCLECEHTLHGVLGWKGVRPVASRTHRRANWNAM